MPPTKFQASRVQFSALSCTLLAHEFIQLVIDRVRIS